MSRSLLALCLTASTLAAAQSADCRSVRRALELAQLSALDDEVLLVLEQQTCRQGGGALVLSQAGSRTCADVTTLWTLARLAAVPAEVMGQVEAQRAIHCSTKLSSGAVLRWPDGATFRSSSGSLYWPSGPVARAASGSWYYPNGTLARSVGGTLSYPSGQTARSVSGTWHLPSGPSVDEDALTAAACSKAPEQCQPWLDYLGQVTGDARDFAVMTLGWTTR
jgi:hypothetical protein